MKKRTDELLNKYLDNELDSAELNEFTSMLENDENVVKGLKAMKAVEQSVKQIEFENAPADITSIVMRKIASAGSVKRSNWFFWVVVSVFLIAIAAVTYYSVQQYQPSPEGIGAGKTVETVKTFFGEQAKAVNSLLKGADIKFIGTVLSLLILIAGYFIYETHRNFKNKLKSLT